MVGNWILIIQNKYYYTNYCKDNGLIFDDNFDDVIVFKNYSKQKVRRIGESVFKGLKCFWNVVEYDEAKKEFEEATYIKHNGSKYKIDKPLQVSEALQLVRNGECVLCNYKGVNTVFIGECPNDLSVDVIIEGKWNLLINKSVIDEEGAKAKRDKLSRFISLILRHKPEVINIKLDEFGYANVDELINGINKSNNTIDLETLKKIVQEDNKQRYSFNNDLSKIRANQGHSINVNVGLKEVKPPKYLYHGTGEKYLESILEKGINKGNRLHTHLSLDIKTAIDVGKRHGKPVILKVNASKMYEDNYKFYLSENNVWLTDYVPTAYFEVLKDN